MCDKPWNDDLGEIKDDEFGEREAEEDLRKNDKDYQIDKDQ